MSRLDLVAQPAITAMQGDTVIAVEVKGFRPTVKMPDLEKAVGQYLIYKSWLTRKHPTWTLYLAISSTIARFFDQEPLRVLCEDYSIRLLIVDIAQERIIEWKS
jgi:hypothetical protein